MTGKIYGIATCLIIWLVVTFASSTTARAQNSVTGIVVDAATGTALPRANIRIISLHIGTQTDHEGGFTLSDLRHGQYQLLVSMVGYVDQLRTVQIPSDRLRISMTREDIVLPGIRVSVLRPDLQSTSRITAEAVERSGAQDVGHALRHIPGIDAVRRGPLGFDPSVRGLRETEVGVYIDGARHFPAGPARMDSPLSHFDPNGVEMMQVVKGPYALTWGPGNLSAIRVTTPNLWALSSSPTIRVTSGLDDNQGVFETSASVSGATQPLSYWVQGAWRQGDDYDSGSGASVPADFKSGEVRGKVGFKLSPRSHVVFSGGYSEQNDLDYPGRLLDATFFETYNVSAELTVTSSHGGPNIEVLAYANGADHGMNNDQKPTAQANTDRVPPFPIGIIVDTKVSVLGGRFAVEWPSAISGAIQAGIDLSATNRIADRTVSNRSNGMTVFEDIVWPDADLLTLGGFSKYDRSLNERVTSSTSVRLDYVRSQAGQVSDFFRQNTTGDLDQTEIHLSAATSLITILNDHWSGSLGLGTAVRTADALERYSDRFPASKAQMPAEFMGNPELRPERSYQMDIGLEGSIEKVAFRTSVFYRHMKDYITIAATNLPKRLPLSPNTVFQYRNGDADFWGLEVDGSVALTRAISLTGGISYLHGEDEAQGEPAIGVSPLQLNAGLRIDDSRFFGELGLLTVAEQDRVASSRGEQPTSGYTTLDAMVGLRPISQVEIRAGVRNLADEAYANHLNAKNPFAGGARVPEPGRTFYGAISIGLTAR